MNPKEFFHHKNYTCWDSGESDSSETSQILVVNGWDDWISYENVIPDHRDMPRLCV
jgi:hypothetical protein